MARRRRVSLVAAFDRLLNQGDVEGKRVTYGSGRVSHGQDPFAVVLTKCTNRFRATFIEGTRKCRFVRSREATPSLVPS
jgi:hypothetical protein